MKALINNKQTNQSIRSIKLSINYSIRITLESIHQLITSKEKKKKVSWNTPQIFLRCLCNTNVFFKLRIALLTCLQAESLGGFDLYWSKWDAVNLQASYSSTEITLVSNTGSHPCWIVRSQSYPADSRPRNFPVIDVQSGNSRTLIIGSGDEIPSLWFNEVRLHWRCKLSCTRHETYQQHSPTDHPQVHAKPVRLVIEDWTNWSIRIYPSQDRDGIPGVQTTFIQELYVTVCTTLEPKGATRPSVWTQARSHICHAP